MMDVERIQKINALALELMKQGLASDREDATIQAERIFSSKSGTETSAIREIMRPEAKTEVRSTISQSTSPQGADDLGPEKVKDILEQNTKFLVKTIKEFHEKIQSLEKEMASIKTRMTYSRPMEQAPQRGSEAAAPSEKPAAAPASHPRTGNFKEGEVSIEKFFYMGNKR